MSSETGDPKAEGPGEVMTLPSGPLPVAFTAIADQVRPIMWLMVGAQHVSWVNQSAAAYFDLPTDALLADRWLAVLAPADIPRYSALLAEVLTRKTPVVHSFHVRAHGDQRRRMTVCLTPVALGDGQAGIFGVGMDTTDQQSAWDEATRKARLVDGLMSLLTEGVVLHGPDGTITFANAAAEAILGLPSSVITGSHSLDKIWEVRDAAFHPFPGDQHPAQVTLRTGEPQRDVLMAVYRGTSRESASWRWLSVNSRAVPNLPERGDRSVLVTFTDVTEARAHEERRVLLAREEEARHAAQIAARRASLLADALHALVSGLSTNTQAPDAFLRLLVPDLADSCVVVLRDQTSAALIPFGHIARCERDTVIIGRGDADLPAPDDPTHPLAVAVREDRGILVADLGDGWRSWTGFTPKLRSDGQECRPISAAACPVRGSQDVIGGILLLSTVESARQFDADDLATLRDIADRLGLAIENSRLIDSLNAEVAVRRAAQERLANEQATLATLVDARTRELTDVNEQLRRSLRLKDEFLASMSHELRTPLNAILGTVELMSAGLSGPVSETQAEDLSIIEQSGRHLLSLINDILDLAKIESGTMSIVVSSFEAGDVVRKALQLVSSNLAGKDLHLTQTLPTSPVPVTSDQRLLTQILLNLLSNAIKFTHHGGRITVSLRHDMELGRVVLTVEDTGIGIDPEDMPRIFLPFEQADGSLSRAHVGTGLGLALVAKMVDLLDGNVEVSSVPQQGSRFTVTIPSTLTTARGRVTPMEPLRAIAADAASILVVDDNVANMRTMRSYLHANGFAVREAYSGIEAINACGEQHPDLIIMDIQMPRMDGMTAIEHIRSDPTLRAVPIIAVTALAMPGDRERILASGANEYLAKPIRLHDLEAIIRRLLATAAHAPPPART
jgi:signal transduction histidine kinase/PAS domain-containing protein/ActR/RegA family two-component response regulator